MATSYLNTGVLGQVAGGTLSIGGLKSEFEQLKANVKRKKRTISGVSEAEREAQRKRREARMQDAERETTVKDETGKVVKEGVRLDTADIAPPAIPVTPDAPKDAAPEVKAAVKAKQAEQTAANVEAKQQTIVKAPTVAAPPPAPAPKKLAPEKQFTDADRAFASAYSAFSTEINSKNSSSVRSGAGALQASLTNVLTTAKATGRADVIKAVGGITGVLGNKDISSRNVGQAKASTLAASASIRGSLDIDTLMRQAPAAAPVVQSQSILQTALKPVSRRYGGRSSRDFYRSLRT